MEISSRDDLTGKLILFLKKVTECKKFDSIYTEKFLSSISKEFPNISESITSAFSEWLLEIFQKWKQTNPNAAEAIFIFKFIGVVTKNEIGFEFLLNSNVLVELTNFLQSNVFEQAALTPVYISFLSDILAHASGYEWIKNTKQWKTVSKLYFSNTNLYIEREGLNFLIKFISKVILDNEGSKEILQELFLHLSTYNEINIEDPKVYSVILVHLKLIQSLLEAHIFSENSLFLNKLVEVFDLQLFLSFLLENCKQEIVLEKASVTQVILTIFQCKNKKKLKDLSTVVDSFLVLLKNNQFNGIIKLAQYCQALWSKMRRKMECEKETEIDYTIVQLLPGLMYTKTSSGSCDDYLQKLSLLSTPKTQRFYYLLKDEINSKTGSKPKNLALKGILSVISSTECLNSEEAVIIFQAMAHILNSFILDDSSSSEVVNFNVFEKEILLDSQDIALLSAVLNAMCVLIEKFKIKWSESLESLCLFKMGCKLLENPNLPAVVIVQVFLLIKLGIINYTFPNSTLLPNIPNYSFDWLMSLLFKRLHDPNWEIRDSCLEVITAVTELSISKYPAFEQQLVEKKFCPLVFDIMEGDSESYVRASAIQALTAMTKVEALKEFLFSMNISQKIIQLLQNESEAIVRREAALMIKQLYLVLDDSHDEIANSFYEVMSYSAICDLHWEVKLNSLIFWEGVVKQISTNNLVNGYTPTAIFSKEEELNKILKRLSEIGCLYVLLTTLNDDCDMPVIQKSAQILSELMGILDGYGTEEFFKNIPINEGVPVKRKKTIWDTAKKKKSLSLVTESNSDGLDEINSPSLSNNKYSNSSDVVIDEIVNEMDINLLGVCFQKGQTVNLQKKTILQEVKPESFLLQMQNFNFEKFLEDKQKWLINVEVDFKSLLLETCTVGSTDETNVMDCY